MRPPDPFEDSDAAYVLGLLGADECQAFEDHLATCEACKQRVRELRGTADLLGHLTEADLLVLDRQDDLTAEAPSSIQVPETLLPALLRQSGVTRRRRRRMTLVLSGLVAACLIALAVVVYSPSSTPRSGGPVAMKPVAVTNLRATATVSERDWGTEVQLDCTYATSAGTNGRHTFGLVVVDRNGARQSLGTWTVLAGTHTEFSSGTALRTGQVRALEITGNDGRPVLSLNI